MSGEPLAMDAPCVVEVTEALVDGLVKVVLEDMRQLLEYAGPAVDLLAGLAHLEVMVLGLPWLVLIVGQASIPSLP